MKNNSLARKIGLLVTVAIFLFTMLFFFESIRRVHFRQLTEQLDQLEEVAHGFNLKLSAYLPLIQQIERDRHKGRQERLLEIHGLLQPIVDELIHGDEYTSVGYYSKKLEAIVAITPYRQFHHLLGQSLDDKHPSHLLYGEQFMQREISHVFRGWVVRYAMGVYQQGELVGHIWANLPISVLYKKFLPSFLFSLFLGSLGVLVGKLLSSYITRYIMLATDALGCRMDSLSHETLDKEDLLVTCQEIPLEFQPLWEKFSHSVTKIRDLTVELTISARMAALGDLITIVAHDIRNPLSIIMARAQLGKRKTCGDGDEYFEGILAASQLIDRFLERILILARVDTCKKKEYSVHETLTELLELWSTLLKHRKISLQIDIEEDLPFVVGDAIGFQQAILNLFKNAMEAISTEGSIMVGAKREEGGVLITISDTGLGIPEDVKGQIFKRFFTTKDSKGSGIGLALAHSVITNHGGQIWFDTILGEGTTFYLFIPVDPTY